MSGGHRHLSLYPAAAVSRDARWRMLTCLGFVAILVSTPVAAWGAFGIYAGLLAVALALAPGHRWQVLRRSLIVIPFLLLVAISLPFHARPPAEAAHSGQIQGWAMVATVLIKAWMGTLALALLLATTSFPSLLLSMSRLRIPPVIVTLLGFIYRYVFVIGEEASRMLRAREARATGRGRGMVWHCSVLGQMVATLFLRSYERGERIYLAMKARGFEGGAVAMSAPAAKRPPAEAVAAVCTLCLLLAVRVGCL